MTWEMSERSDKNNCFFRSMIKMDSSELLSQSLSNKIKKKSFEKFQQGQESKLIANVTSGGLVKSGKFEKM